MEKKLEGKSDIGGGAVNQRKLLRSISKFRRGEKNHDDDEGTVAIERLIRQIWRIPSFTWFAKSRLVPHIASRGALLFFILLL